MAACAKEGTSSGSHSVIEEREKLPAPAAAQGRSLDLISALFLGLAGAVTTGRL